jgi:RNA polymerase sigma-70 factor, ECF subfamily
VRLSGRMHMDPLTTLWENHAKAVYGYLLRLTRSEADASDFLQEVFSRFVRNPALIDSLEEPRGYLLRLARNAVVDQARRAGVQARAFERIGALHAGDTFQAENPDAATLRRALGEALGGLPKEQQAVVRARLYFRHTLDQIANDLGISINTAASRYRYGIDKMREALRPLYEDFAGRPLNSNQKP